MMMMLMMKKRIILVTCILLFSSLAVMASQNTFGPDECCFQFVLRRLPRNGVVSYKHTDAQCPKKAVLFSMRNGAELCVDPSVQWVQDIISAKDRFQAKNLTRSGSN